MNYVTNEVQDNQQRGLLSAMFGDSRKMGLDSALNGITMGESFSNDDMDVNSSQTQITFKNISLVRDTDTTNDYQFGCFDIHPNGSNYGTAINPYTAANTTQGADGYDLSWAVDSSGEPVALDHITKIRAYTTAALEIDPVGHSNTDLFTKPSIFGETSAEVCGIYGVNGTSGSGASKKPTIKNGNTTIFTSDLGCKTINVSGSITLTFSTTADRMFVNGVSEAISGVNKTYTVAGGTTKYVQVITQNGSESPYVTVLKLVG